MKGGFSEYGDFGGHSRSSINRDDRRRDLDYMSEERYSPNRRRERSYDSKRQSDIDKRSSHTLCIRKISLRHDIDYLQELLHSEFSPFGSVDIRIFKSSDKRLALLKFRYVFYKDFILLVMHYVLTYNCSLFRHSSDCRSAYKSKRHISIQDRSLNVEIWDESEPILRETAAAERRDESRHRTPPKRSSASRRSRSPVGQRIGSIHGISSSRSHYSNRARHDSNEPEERNDPKATRTLFVGSLEPDITDLEVREAFERYGIVEQVDVKHPNTSHAYAFVRFANVDMAVLSRSKMNGNPVRSFHCKIGYGKPFISSSLYISGLDNWRDQEELECFLNQFGTLLSLDWQSSRNCATAHFENSEVAEEVNQQLKALALRRPDRRLLVDFVDNHPQGESLVMPRQSSLIPLPTTPFSVMPELMQAGLTTPNLPFANPFVAAALGFMRNAGPPETSTPIFPTQPADDARFHQQRRPPVRQGEPPSALRPPPPRRPVHPAPSRYSGGARNNSPLMGDSLLPESSDTHDPVLSSIVSMPDLEAFLRPALWSAELHTKKSIFRFRCLHVAGDESLGKKELPASVAFSDTTKARFQMPQQAHTDASWMADAVQHLDRALSESPPPFSILLALPEDENLEDKPKSEEPDQEVERPLTCLVSYLRLKQRAAFLKPMTNGGEKADEAAFPYTCMLFTPSSFSLSLLKFAAPRLSSELAFVDDFLVLLVLRH